MLIKFLILFSFSIYIYSCASVQLNKGIEVNEDEDWLMIGGNPERTNVSNSPSKLDPPFNLFWQYDVDGGLSKNCLSASDAILFVSTLNGEFYSLDISSGKSLGRTSTLGKASFSTPLIFNNNIILTSSGSEQSRIFSYNVISGLQKWARNVKWVQSSPVMVDENIIVSNTFGELYKLNAGSGTIIWKTKSGKALTSFYTSPAVSENRIYIGSNDHYMYSFESAHGKELWKFKTDASIFCDASVNNGKIYFGSDDKNFYCIDTSGKLIWKKDLGTKFLSSPAFYKESIIVSCIDGNVYSLNSSDGETIWKYTTFGAITASPLIHSDKIFIGSYDKNFYCLNAKDGKELWKYQCEGRIHTSAVIWKDFVFVGSDNKYVYCFK